MTIPQPLLGVAMSRVGLFFAAIILVVISLSFAAEPAPKRQPWIASKIIGSPEPAPRFKAINAFPNVKFTKPLVMTSIPGTNRLVVGEEQGKLYSFANAPEAKAEMLFDCRADITTVGKHPGAKGVDALYGVVFDPNFAQNRYCYLCYTMKGKQNEKNLADGSRVSRFRVTTADPPRLDPSSEEILLTFLQGGHNGGDLHFGPDGYLYISTGDATDPNPPDIFTTGQDVSDLLSSILRIDVQRKQGDLNYAIPKDNPFVGQSHNGKPIRGEVWSYGFRNPWRMGFDRITGDLYAGDVGWEAWEMIHKIEKGSNHGWSVVEAGQTVNSHLKVGPTPIRPPMIEYSHALGGSVTGGYVYRGKKHPELYGVYIFGDWMTRRIWGAKLRDGQLQSMEDLTAPTVRIVAFAEDPFGELYLVDYDTGTIHTLAKNDAAAFDSTTFPRTLSATGLYASTKDGTPASGVYPFQINARQWQDYTTAEYWAAFPNMASATDYENKRELPGEVNWRPFHLHIPKNGVLVKTISYETEHGNAQSKKRLETQLIHYDGDAMQFYTYAWRDDQSDADLMPSDGGEKLFSVKDQRFGGTRNHTWTFSSRVQCGQCHNNWALYTLGFNREQLSKDIDTPQGKTNQLIWLNELGLIQRVTKDNKPRAPFGTSDLMKIEELVDPHALNKPLTDRARSYLHVNCGHCHRFGGGGAVEFHVDREADIRNPKLWDAKPTRGNFDLPEARILAPGDPHRSVLYYRMAKFGSGRMPHMGSELPDEAGLKLIGDWIASLKDGSTLPEIKELPLSELVKRLRTPSTALAVARGLGANTLPKSTREEICKIVATLPSGSTKDLFEGYLPSDGKPRTLGSNPKPRGILAMKGDAAKGKVIFNAQKTQCATCHKMDGQGQEVGPDLSAIGKTRTRELLLESLLEPSRRIDPQYQSYRVRLHSGKTLTGLVVKRDDTGVVVKDAQGKLQTITNDDVESLDASRQSIMPEGLLRDLTPQDAADLLEYLCQRK